MYRNWNINKFLKIASLACAGLTVSAHSITFKITEITNVPAGTTPFDLNNNGEVVLNDFRSSRAFYWSASTGAIELENLERGEVRNINDSGTIVGHGLDFSTIKGQIFYWETPQSAPQRWKHNPNVNYTVSGISNDNVLITSARSSGSCSGSPAIFQLDLNDITQSTPLPAQNRSGCYTYGLKGITSGNTFFGQEYNPSVGSAGMVWFWSEPDNLYLSYGYYNTPTGYESGYFDSGTGLTHVGFPSHNGTCIISSITLDRELREGIRYGMVGEFCSVDSINKSFAIGRVADNTSGQLKVHPYFLERPTDRLNTETSTADAMDMNNHISPVSSGWQIKRVYDINDKNQFTAKASYLNGPELPVLVETIPSIPNKPLAVVNGRTVTLSWIAVGGADYYLREVSVNGDAWKNNRTLTGTSKVYYNYARNSYRYRLKACNAQGCSDWSPVSNSITVN